MGLVFSFSDAEDIHVVEIDDLNSNHLNSNFTWPVPRYYTITSYFEYRWGSFHNAIDIYVGYGSPIYAANNGVVEKIGTGCTPGYLGCNGRQGNYILINHTGLPHLSLSFE